MMDAFRPVQELSVVIPGLVLAYCPVKSYLKQSQRRLFGWLLPLFLCLSIGGGGACYRLHVSTAPALAVLLFVEIRNGRFSCLRAVRLHQQPFQSHQCSHDYQSEPRRK